MAKKKSSYPARWNDITNDAGEKVGSWALHDGELLVMAPSGASKRVRPSVGGHAGNGALARIVLTEPDMR